MKFIEIMGFPGSGKSTFRNKFNNKKNFFTLEYIFFKKIFFENKSFKIFILMILFFIFKKKFYDYVFNSYLNKNNFFFLKVVRNKIDSIQKNKTYNHLCKQYKKLLGITSISNFRKRRANARFKYFAGMYFYVIRNNNNKKIIILQDEGFYQKIFLNYKHENKHTYKLINNYLKSIPKIDKILFINENIDTCISRLEKKRFFMYKNINVEKKIFLEIKKIVNINKNYLFIILDKTKIKNSKNVIKLINNL